MSINIPRMACEEGLREDELRSLLFPITVAFTSLEEARQAYLDAPSGSRNERYALAAWREFSTKQIADASTPEDARKAYENAPEMSKVKRYALAAWRASSTKQIADASTPEDACKAYLDAPNGKEKRQAMVRWLSLCSTLKHAREAYHLAERRSEEERLALVKIASFYEE
jgi:hypothetical protein